MAYIQINQLPESIDISSEDFVHIKKTDLVDYRMKLKNLMLIGVQDTKANLTTSNPILKRGQFSLETDTKVVKIGDGVTPYNLLSPASNLATNASIGKLTPQIRESLRRSYAEARFNLVDGSFEAGGTLVDANDVLLQESTGKAFSGPAGTVAAGTNPASGGFVDRSNEPSFWSTGRGRLTISTGAPTGTPLENEEWVMIGNVG